MSRGEDLLHSDYSVRHVLVPRRQSSHACRSADWGYTRMSRLAFPVVCRYAAQNDLALDKTTISVL